MEHDKEISHFCSYFQAHVVKEEVWFFVALIRSYEHMMFDRTLDVENSIFEFFVPIDMEQKFLCIINIFEKKGIVYNLHKDENRLIHSDIV